MFDIGWTEILVIVAVAVIVVGPKDIPKMLRSIGKYVRKARTMMRDVRRQVEEVADISELKDLKAEAENLKKFADDSVAEVTAKPAVKTTSSKQVDTKEASAEKTTTIKTTIKKPATKKSATKKSAAKKAATKKTAAKKSTAKKPKVKKTATKKAAAKKTS